jgi:nitroreductase
MEYDEVVLTRRSVHEYSDESVDAETLDRIFEAVRYTPSSYNLQPWEFLVLQDEESRAKLQEVAYGQEQVTDAPVGIVVLANTDPATHGEAVAADLLRKGYLPNEEAEANLNETFQGMRERPDEENRLWAANSTSLATKALLDAAWNEGLATCPMGGFDADALVDAFDIDEGYDPVMVVTLGYPADDASDLENPRKFRREVSEFVHHGSFDPTAATLPEEPTTETHLDAATTDD